MRLIDLSQPLYHGCPNCPAHPSVGSEQIVTHESGGWQLEMLSLVNHTGSHIDAPLHKIPGGRSLDDIPLESFTGNAFIADFRGIKANQPMGADQLAARLSADLSGAIVLLATGWGRLRARTQEWLNESPYLAPDGARWLVDRGVRGVGIDHYSVGGCNDAINIETHTVLLGADLWVVEELRFPDEVFSLPQPVEFWSLPINLQGHSGAFCRPVIVAP